MTKCLKLRKRNIKAKMQTLSRNTEDWDRQNTKVKQAVSLGA